MKNRICQLVVFAAVACISLRATAVCPTEHFEPTLEFGSAFGAPEGLRALQPAELEFAKEETDEVLVYFEYQTRDPGFLPVYSISLLRHEAKGDGLLSVHRMKDNKIVSSHVGISASEINALLAQAVPVLLRTHYAAKVCSSHYLDGFIAQMAVAIPTGSNAYGGLIGGQVYSPDPETEAGQMVSLARRLKARVIAAQPTAD